MIPTIYLAITCLMALIMLRIVRTDGPLKYLVIGHFVFVFCCGCHFPGCAFFLFIRAQRYFGKHGCKFCRLVLYWCRYHIVYREERMVFRVAASIVWPGRCSNHLWHRQSDWCTNSWLTLLSLEILFCKNSSFRTK